jgi:recombination protein RecT
MAEQQAITVKKRLEELRDLIERFKPQLAQVAAQHLSPERLMALTLSAASRNQKLALCTGQSVLKGMMDAAQLGLEIGGPLAGGWLVPYENRKTGKLEAQWITGYQGLIDLARRSAMVDSISAGVVREGDRFTFSIDEMGPHILHKPDLEGDGPLRAVYAVARLKGTVIPQVEVMTKKQIDGIRTRSRAKDSGPWVSDYDEMARKTVVRRLIKYLPKSAELAKAVAIEDQAETSEPEIDPIDLDPDYEVEQPKTQTEKVKEELQLTEE